MSDGSSQRPSIEMNQSTPGMGFQKQPKRPLQLLDEPILIGSLVRAKIDIFHSNVPTLPYLISFAFCLFAIERQSHHNYQLRGVVEMKKAKTFYVLYSNYGPFTPKMYTNLEFISQIKSPNNPVLEFKIFQQKYQAEEFLATRTSELEKLYQKQPEVKKEKKPKSKVVKSVSEEKVSEQMAENNEKQSGEKKSEAKPFVGQKKQKVSQSCHQATRIFFDNFIRLPLQVRDDYSMMNLFRPGKLVHEVDPNFTYNGEFDGCCKKNPGVGGVGYLIKMKQNLVLSNSLALGRCTNNIAQFMAMLLLLTDAYCNNIRRMRVRGDSNLAIKAMNGSNHMKNIRLAAIYRQTRLMANLFQQIQFTHYPRTCNGQADSLANKGVKLKKYLPKPLPQKLESLWQNDSSSAQ